MVCCFFNLHEQENAKYLVKHFDKEIEHAIDWGCSTFIAGTKHPEDHLFAQRVMEAAKYYTKGEIVLLRLKEDNEEKLKQRFLQLADWEIYAFER